MTTVTMEIVVARRRASPGACTPRRSTSPGWATSTSAGPATSSRTADGRLAGRPGAGRRTRPRPLPPRSEALAAEGAWLAAHWLVPGSAPEPLTT